MENKVKGTNDCGNSCRSCWYCGNGHQHHRYYYEYHTIPPET